MKFTQFYAAAPVCSPSRAGLLTGPYPVRAGVPDNVSSQQGNAGLPVEQVTIGPIGPKDKLFLVNLDEDDSEPNSTSIYSAAALWQIANGDSHLRMVL